MISEIEISIWRYFHIPVFYGCICNFLIFKLYSKQGIALRTFLHSDSSSAYCFFYCRVIWQSWGSAEFINVILKVMLKNGKYNIVRHKTLKSLIKTKWVVVGRNSFFLVKNEMRVEWDSSWIPFLTPASPFMTPTLMWWGGFETKRSTRLTSVAVTTVRVKGSSLLLYQDLSQCWLDKTRKAFSSKSDPSRYNFGSTIIT